MRFSFLIILWAVLFLDYLESYALTNEVSKQDTLYSEINQLIHNDTTFQKQWQQLMNNLANNSIARIISYSESLAPDQQELIALWNKELYQIYNDLEKGFEDKIDGRKPLILISDSPDISIEVGKLKNPELITGISKRLKLSEKGLYILVISTKTLNDFGSSRDQIAGLLAHEMAHIKNGDLDKAGMESYVNRLHSKANELAADLGAIELCKGKFSLRSLINNFTLLQKSRSTGKNKTQLVNTLNLTHPADEVRKNSSALAAIDALMINPQYDLNETKLSFPALMTYSRFKYASKEQHEELIHSLSTLDKTVNNEDIDKLTTIVKQTPKSIRSKLLNEILNRITSNLHQNTASSKESLTLLLQIPHKLDKVELLADFTGLSFEHWFHSASEYINEFNPEEISYKEKESLFRLCLQKANSDYLIRYRQNDYVKQFFQKILVPFYKNTSMWLVYFANPLALDLVYHLKKSTLPVTPLEVQNLEMMTRRYYIYFQSLPGAKSIYGYYEKAKSELHNQNIGDFSKLGKEALIDRLINSMELYELESLSENFPKILNWYTSKNIEELKQIFLTLSFKFDWQLRFIEKLSERLPLNFIFYSPFIGDMNINEEIKKMFYQTLSTERATTEQKIMTFKLLIGSNIHYDPKILNLMSHFYKKLSSEQQRSFFNPQLLLDLSDNDLNRFKTENNLASEKYFWLIKASSYYIELLDLFHKRNLDLPLNGVELGQLVKFLNLAGQYSTINTNSHIVKYLTAQLIKHKSELPTEEFAKIFNMSLDRIAYSASRAAMPHVFPKNLDEFSSEIKKSLQKTNQWNLKSVSQFHKHNAFFLNLSSSAVSDLLEQELSEALKTGSREQKINKVQTLFKDLRNTYFLHLTHRISYIKIFEKTLEQLHISPTEYKSFKSQAIDESLTLDKTSSLEKMLVDFGDGILEWTLTQEPSKQLEIIDYILDSERMMPDWIVKPQKEAAKDGEMAEHISEAIEKVENLKSNFHRSDPVIQSAIVSYFLTDSQRSLLKSSYHESLLIRRLTKGLSSTQIEMANAFYKAMKKTDPNFYTHMLSRAVVLKSNSKSKSNDSSSLLVPLVEYFDVPGIKLAQMSHFGFQSSEKMEGFEKFYETAVTQSNSQILEHLNELYGDSFPKNWKFIKPIGFGSANYAVLFYDDFTKHEFVLNVPRKNINEISKQKFAYFETFLKHLTQEMPEKEEIINLLHGLSRFLKRSMDLEFDRNRVFQRTKIASSVYSGKIKGWNFKPVQAGAIDSNGVISMSLAKGNSLASLEKSKPDQFKKASEVISEFLGDRLLSKSPSVRLNTNGDWHPGQFFIDQSNSQVTILDFGQESAISANELIFAKDILAIISIEAFSKYTDFDSLQAFHLLKKSLKEQLGLELSSTSMDGFNLALSKTNTMSRFVYLISYLENQGIEIPVSSGHWIKEVNAILNFEREASNKNQFSQRLKKELYTHLKQRNPNMKTAINVILQNKIGKMESAVSQTLKKMTELFRFKSVNDRTDSCLKFYK